MSETQKFRKLQKALEEKELSMRYSDDWSPSFHNQVKVIEDSVPERMSEEQE
jgi:hypothetical protein